MVINPCFHRGTYIKMANQLYSTWIGFCSATKWVWKWRIPKVAVWMGKMMRHIGTPWDFWGLYIYIIFIQTTSNIQNDWLFNNFMLWSQNITGCLKVHGVCNEFHGVRGPGKMEVDDIRPYFVGIFPENLPWHLGLTVYMVGTSNLKSTLN